MSGNEIPMPVIFLVPKVKFTVNLIRQSEPTISGSTFMANHQAWSIKPKRRRWIDDGFVARWELNEPVSAWQLEHTQICLFHYCIRNDRVIKQ